MNVKITMLCIAAGHHTATLRSYDSGSNPIEVRLLHHAPLPIYEWVVQPPRKYSSTLCVRCPSLEKQYGQRTGGRYAVHERSASREPEASPATPVAVSSKEYRYLVRWVVMAVILVRYTLAYSTFLDCWSFAVRPSIGHPGRA